MQSIHHVVMPMFEGSKNPGRLQYVEFEGSIQESPTQPVGGGRCETATVGNELHCKRASGELVGSETRGGELHVKIPDRRVLFRLTRDSFNVDGEDLRRHERAIIQIHP